MLCLIRQYFHQTLALEELHSYPESPNITLNEMNDWAAPLIAAALFAFLSPGLLLQIPGKHHPIDFMNMKTSAAAIFVHAVLYALFLILFLVVLHVRLYI
ncbi:hypothetical protein V6N11_076410 [Hibiscus sabdariffa]|uniref:Transmembrane protein n=1 Tax=Hibiscus sabdariffa TaxID=183260 RepID=A0ABR2Q673_9ROSI